MITADRQVLVGRRTLLSTRTAVVVSLVGIAAASALLRVALLRQVHGPWVFLDELVYQKQAQSIGETGRLALFDKAGVSYSPLYSILLAPIYALGASASAAYSCIKTVNAVLISLSVFPVYGIGRYVLPRRWALGAAAVMTLAPLMYYSALTMSENAAYPLFLASVWALLGALHVPSRRRDAVLLLLLVLTCAARIQLVALVPASITAILLVPLLSPATQLSRARGVLLALRSHELLVGALTLGLLMAVGGGLLHGGAHQVVGRYADVVHAALPSPWRVVMSAGEHLAELDVAVGVVPFAGSLVAAYALFKHGGGVRSTAFGAVALSTTFWLLLETGYFAAGFAADAEAPRLFERYVFYVVPLFVVGLMSATRFRSEKVSFRTCIVAAGVAGILPVIIPFGRVVNDTTVADTFSLQLFARDTADGAGYTALTAAPHATIAVVALAALLAFTHVLVRGRVVPTMVILSLVFVFLSAVAGQRIVGRANGATRLTLARLDWVDATRPRGDVTLVTSLASQKTHWRQTASQRLAVWETTYNNLSIQRVYFACAPVFGADFGEQQVSADRSGQLEVNGTYLRAAVAVVPARLGVKGRILASDARSGLDLVAPEGGLLRVQRGTRFCAA